MQTVTAKTNERADFNRLPNYPTALSRITCITMKSGRPHIGRSGQRAWRTRPTRGDVTQFRAS